MSGEDAGTSERETVSSINAKRSDPETLNSLNVDKRDQGHNGSDAMAKAISTLLGSVIRDFDARTENAAKSQDQLSAALDRLMSELDKLLEDAPLPFIMQHAAKISGVRKRVSSLNMLLKSIQRRVDNIDRMLSAGISQEKVTTEIIGEVEHSQVLMHEL
ncbi:hypothetical protein H6P81_019775 [Aristolochia fimbriata]|uniref:Biogenesis of lysosome-related organelles complex 1 subunit 7 n=1 Tax=Aristolochia fimbriata TaxID=158543 RepID=A0AAV7DSK9_ARIFI|nr:hypothetical protein H6P81_019775 [Aristolochia fimbriata]